ncbi:nucleotidyltransferase family protein [Vibrio parahaemolyticus]|nr:nucleotidyltransferase family protein [Vibrio parahaemolyticus]EJB0392012.1 nucleotidyltransferase family protein [Vibrio parahaemolyticus]
MLEHQLEKLIRNTPELMETAQACIDVGLPDHFIAGGSVTQLIWNSLSGERPLKNVKDFDIVYFDIASTSNEESYSSRINSIVNHKVPIDVVNQARVHEWYPHRFGQTIPAYTKVEHGIDSWLSAFAIGFRLNSNGTMRIYSPYGLTDAFNKRVKPNPIAMTRESYNQMVDGYRKRWPDITVEPWE